MIIGVGLGTLVEWNEAVEAPAMEPLMLDSAIEMSCMENQAEKKTSGVRFPSGTQYGFQNPRS